MIQGVLFDMDGLMFDTERLAVETWLRVGAEYGFPIDRDTVISTCGLDGRNSGILFRRALGEDFEFERYRKIKLGRVLRRIEEEGMPIKPGLIELLTFLRGARIKAAVATSSPLDRTEYYLAASGVRGYFDKIVCGDMIERGKPEPDIYLRAAEEIGRDPADCLALEDAPMGILSAYRAGTKPVMVPDLIQPDAELTKLLYAKCDSLADVIPLIQSNL